MTFLDAQLPPTLAIWLTEKMDTPCYSVSYLGLRHATDLEIFEAARKKNAIAITKDDDFVKLLHRFGSPPRVIWLTCGNTSKERLKTIFA